MKHYPLSGVGRFDGLRETVARAGRIARGLAGGVLLVLAGCGSSTPAAEVDRSVTRGLDRSERFVDQSGPPAAGGEGSGAGAAARPVVVIDGEAVMFEQLRPRLVEASGGLVLEEVVLDIALDREASARGLTIGAAEVQRERELLVQAFAGAGATQSGDEAARVLRSIRASRGLGETRFSALLRRNATLRAMVADEVRVTPLALDQAYSMRYGERRRARLITVATAKEAEQLAGRLRKGETFAELAVKESTDSSASRGGLLEPISGLDPAYPAAVRSALAALKPGQVSEPVALEEGYALLMLEEVIPPESGAPKPEEVREELERQVRAEQERLLMNQRARRIVEGATVTVLDRPLDKAWRERKNQTP